jgi:hypothetical protein
VLFALISSLITGFGLGLGAEGVGYALVGGNSLRVADIFADFLHRCRVAAGVTLSTGQTRKITIDPVARVAIARLGALNAAVKAAAELAALSPSAGAMPRA